MNEKTEISLPSRLESVDEAAAAAAAKGAALNLPDDALYGIDLAVRETVANAVKHGNKFNETKTVKITFETSPERFVISIEDQGTGFDIGDVPDPTNPENLLKETGRGILFINNFMDEAVWEQAPGGGTIVRLVKNL